MTSRPVGKAWLACGERRVFCVRRKALAQVFMVLSGAAPEARAQNGAWFPLAKQATLESRARLEGSPWAVSGFGGYLFRTSFFETYERPTNLRLEDDAVLGLLVQRRVVALLPHLDLEVEGGLAYRVNEALWEIHGALVLRWDYFPWNDLVYTTLAVALGPSYTFGLSEQERLRSSDGRTNRFLNYASPEITFALPERPHIALFVRHHHRSAVFGLIEGLDTSIDYLVFGLRVRF